jgi:ankyrin repeat protein
MKSPNAKLAAVIQRYAAHPEFLGLEITDPNQPGAMDDTLLHLTARLGALEDMRILIAAGAEVNRLGDLGNTPLHSAALRGQKEAAELLLKCGADPSIINEFGQSAARVALLGNHVAVAELLNRYPL